MSRRAGELLDDIPEIALVDVVDRWLGLVLKRRKRRRGTVVERWFRQRAADERAAGDGGGGSGFGDFVGKLVEMSEEIVSVSGGKISSIGSDGRDV